MQNVVGLTLVAMAMKFGLGAEIQSPTSLSVDLVFFSADFRTTVCDGAFG